jgi:hypothetical protein
MATRQLENLDCGNYFCGYTVGMARPKKPKGEQRKNVLRIRLTEDERKQLDAAASSKTLDTSTWARSELLDLIKLAKPKRK